VSEHLGRLDDAQAADAVALPVHLRLGGDWYCDTNELFEMKRA
jgi:hypothetical protein